MTFSVARSPLRTGPNGWTGLTARRAHHTLTDFCRYFDCVEIGESAVHALKPEKSRLWANKVKTNRDFQFTAVLGHQFTHDRRLSPGDVGAWIDGMQPLQEAGRLACVVMEFPWAFRFSAENRAFLIELRRTFHMFPLVAEFRHDSWLREEAQGTLIDYRVGYVNVDQAEQFRATPPTALLTTGIGYVRMHGRDSSGAAYRYRTEDLSPWVPRIEKIHAHAGLTFVIHANAGAENAIVNALQVRAMTGGSRLAPPEILEANWRDLAEFRAPRPVQTELLAATYAATPERSDPIAA